MSRADPPPKARRSRHRGAEPATAARGRSIPLFLQATETDCGPACLAMVLAWHGKILSPEEVRQIVVASERGTDAAALLRAASSYGLPGRGFQLADLDTLASVPRGSILHWRLNHYVVLDRLDREGGAWILDPARGRYHVDREELDRCFTRIALLFEDPL